MERYDIDDMVTFYFIIYEDGRVQQVRGWTDNKEYASVYMDFHKCKYLRVKKVTDTFENVAKLLDENANDEIALYNLVVRNDPDHKKGKESKHIVAPLTGTEQMLIDGEVSTFMASRINYGYLREAFDYLRDKYQKALKNIFLKDVMLKVTNERNSKFTEGVQLDELLVLFRSLPEHFGE